MKRRHQLSQKFRKKKPAKTMYMIIKLNTKAYHGPEYKNFKKDVRKMIFNKCCLFTRGKIKFAQAYN